MTVPGYRMRLATYLRKRFLCSIQNSGMGAMFSHPTAGVTVGWWGKGSETGTSHSSEKSLKNAPRTSRPGHALLARFLLGRIISCE